MNILKRIYCRTFQTVFKIAIPFLPYRKPKIIGSMKGIPEILKKKHCGNVLIVTDAGIVKAGLVKKLERVLSEENIAYTLYDQTVANPTTANVEEALQLYFDRQCDCLIAFGGGSSMDCAKAVGARAVRPGTPLSAMKGLLKVHKRLPLLLAIPTTAGTGSETTLAAVITDSENRHKYVINDFVLIPRYAVLDPKVTVSLPPHITATTGMDALTHAVESYIGRSTTIDTRRDARKAVRLIFENIEKVYEDGGDLDARRNMLHASFYAGCAFTKSYVGYVHAIAHSLGGEYNIPHGLANAVILPMMLEAYGESVYKKLAQLALAAGLTEEDTPEEEAARCFIAKIRVLNASFGIGTVIGEIREEEIGKLSRYADKEANPLYPVPVLMNAAELESFYYQLMGEGGSHE